MLASLDDKTKDKKSNLCRGRQATPPGTGEPLSKKKKKKVFRK